jgi:hypothetical protein
MRDEKRVAKAILLRRCPSRPQAALSHIAVSKALLISGMFMPKLAFAAAALAAAAFLDLLPASLPVLLVGATSVARSHDPISWERATEKNRNT